MAFPSFPKDYIHPTLTLAQARASGANPASLRAVAAWNERMARGPAKERRRRQAAQLRGVADALEAGNDNAVEAAAAA